VNKTMKFKIAQIIGTIVIILSLQACVSTSLEDTAPTAWNDPSAPTPLNATTPSVLPETQTSPQSLDSDISSINNSGDAATEIVEAKKVETVLPPRRTDEEFPSGANSQLTDVEKAAIEARMTKLLLLRENDPSIKAKYEARLKYLRQISKSHAADAEADIQQ
jgi:hypothetical protein